jgi:DNA (cytosine-5)-methyltransferase 1
VYSAVSLFSGCGGLCEGARLAGFSVLAAVENDRFAVETYRHNFPEVPLFADDVTAFLRDGDERWEPSKDRFENVREASVDLLFGGPPCQGYSQIGPRSLDDPRNRLYREYIRVLSTVRPRVLLMENVPNMLWLSKGMFKRNVLEEFAAAGYRNADVRVVSAERFGVPQSRERAIFFAVRDDLKFPYRAGDWLELVLDSEERDRTTVWDAIGDLPERVSDTYDPLPYPRTRRSNFILDELRLDRDGVFYSAADKTALAGGQRLVHNHHTKEIQERRRRLIGFLEPGAKADSLPKEVWNGTRPEKWRRFHPDRPAHTLLAQMHRDLSEWVHPKYERWITVREAARLQSFHDGFVFKSSEWQMLKQIGNAVPPLLGRAASMVAKRALEHLDDTHAPSTWTERFGQLALRGI